MKRAEVARCRVITYINGKRMPFSKKIIQEAWQEIARAPKLLRAMRIYRRYHDFTMVAADMYVVNLLLCESLAPKTGCVVEAGVWRGGMSAGISDMVPGRIHFLFDSFEGLPPAQEIDGPSALEYQRDPDGPYYYDNCRAERSFAEQAMAMSSARQFHLIAGWFSETVPNFAPPEPIAILRLDGDWYASTRQCLDSLYQHVVPGGLVLIDDYYSWAGCARAVHDFLSAQGSTDRIEKWRGVCYLIKERYSA